MLNATSNSRRSSRRHSQRQRFDPSSVTGRDDPRSPAAGAFSTPARSTAARSNVSAVHSETAGGGPPSTSGPPSSLRSASRSVGNQSGGGSSEVFPGKLPGRSRAVLLRGDELGDKCLGAVGDWGFCVSTNCPFPNHARNRIAIPRDEDRWYTPGRHRRDPDLPVVFAHPYLPDGDITGAARAILENEDMATVDMLNFFQRPENLRRDDDESAEGNLDDASSGEGDGSVQSMDSFGICVEGLEVDDIDLEDELHFSTEVDSDNLVQATKDNRIGIVDITDRLNKLNHYVSALETKTGSSFDGSRDVVRRLKEKIKSLTNRAECLEQDVGDVEETGFSSLAQALVMLRNEYDSLAKHLDEEIDQVDADFNQLQEDVTRTINDALEREFDRMKQQIIDEINNDSSSEDSSTPAPAPTDVDTSVLVDGETYGLERIVRMLLDHDKRISSAEDAIATKDGIVFNGVRFASESAFKEYLLDKGITGFEVSCMVDGFSLAVHETEEDMKESDSTSTSKALLRLGYSMVDYYAIASMFNKSLPIYTGSAKATSMGQLIDCFSKPDRWEGSDGHDGRSTENLNVLTIAKENVGSRAEDFIEDEDIVNACKSNALKSLEFHSFMHKYFNDIRHKLRQRGMPEKDVRMLLSNQLHLIMKSLRAIRRNAYPVSAPRISVLDRLVRQWWVTLLTIQKMDEFIEYGFEHHPIISSSFVRFLTDHLASSKTTSGQDDKALKKLVDEAKKAMEDQVKQLSADVQKCKDKQEVILKYHPELLKPKKK
eukprot:scaffold3548_cov79-Skeletonema_dohrnii-CCMP3373.AAC.1